MFSTLLWVPNHFPQEKNLNKRSFLLEYCEVIFSLAKAWSQSRSARSVVQVLFQALKEFKADISTPPFSVFRADQM